MDFSALFKQAGKVVAENSPAILTAIGVTGTFTTAYFAAKGAYESVEVLKTAEETKRQEFFGDQTDDDENIIEVEPEPLSTQEKIEAVWKLYVPAVISASMTVAAIICASRISDRRTAAMASAYSIVEKSYTEYRQKNIETIGKKKEQELRDKIAQDRIDRSPISKTTLVVTSKGETLCYDTWTDRYFTGNIELIRKAVNDFNAKIINESYASLSEFYWLLGLKPTIHSDYVGWSTDKLLEIQFSGVLDEDSNPALAMEFITRPMERYASAH